MTTGSAYRYGIDYIRRKVLLSLHHISWSDTPIRMCIYDHEGNEYHVTNGTEFDELDSTMTSLLGTDRWMAKVRLTE